jgi:hypothetical protein
MAAGGTLTELSMKPASLLSGTLPRVVWPHVGYRGEAKKQMLVLQLKLELHQLGDGVRYHGCFVRAKGFHKVAGANPLAGDHGAIRCMGQSKRLRHLSGSCGAWGVDCTLGWGDTEAKRGSAGGQFNEEGVHSLEKGHQGDIIVDRHEM